MQLVTQKMPCARGRARTNLYEILGLEDIAVGEVKEDATVSFQNESPKTYVDTVKTLLAKISKNHSSVTWKDTELDRSRTRKVSTSVFTGKHPT